MSTVEQSIELEVPVTTAYNQWTQFEEFPKFMEGVEEVKQLDDTHLHWLTKIAGKEEHFHAEITEQHPDERIAWRSTEGPTHAGVVTFHRLADDRSKIMLQLDAEPEGVVEKVGDALGFLQRRTKGDLERFKELVESRGGATGAWRGDVPAEGAAPDTKVDGQAGGAATGSDPAGASTTGSAPQAMGTPTIDESVSPAREQG